ncbi:hypothetical protein EAH68_09705 [Corynebacterium hylobatis]|uniref:Calpain catalytic domain-containing protein n=1 Tax=Corynebacterium hylobatis TaxID=1859290 RepID=A0A430HX70_9CORY|nr:C2 family cysteine protease [Corynebacterium hylobatis]RSZ62403.1 hypothetical protein EAH68_09705 [Corynebacterium hylobatis]
MAENDYANDPVSPDHPGFEVGDPAGVVNPFALAELINGSKIDWEAVEKPEALLEQLLETPYTELFDPKYGSPLYPGLALNTDNKLEAAEADSITLTDSDEGVETPVGDIVTIEDLQEFLEKYQAQGLQVNEVLRTTARRLRIELDLGAVVPRRISNLKWPKYLADVVLPILSLKDKTDGWEPELIRWEDVGHFFNKAANYSDPIQGAVANCGLIAALASVAWTRPFLIAHKTRPTGPAQEQFICQISFRRSWFPFTPAQSIQVTEQVPVSADGHIIYARSSDPDEIWPAVYEKAYAKWITGNTTDRPNILATAFRNPISILSHITHENSRTTLDTAGSSATRLYDFVRGNSLSGKTVHPMVAWTYNSADNAPDDITYSNETLCAAHAYSVLGWAYRNNRRYVVLRNPWGVATASASKYTLNETWYVHHISWWKPITLGAAGVFALEASLFKKYFGWIGVAKR